LPDADKFVFHATGIKESYHTNAPQRNQTAPIRFISAQIKGLDTYDQLYADSRKWILRGWCDYFAPQLYWRIESSEQSFPALLKWWVQQNSADRQLLAGLNSDKLPAEEIARQIRLTRKQTGTSGHIHWTVSSIMNKAGLAAALRELYKEPALIPAATWLDHSAPARPRLLVSSGNGKLIWTCPTGDRPSWWVLQLRQGKTWSTRILPGSRSSLELSAPLPSAVAMAAVDRCGNMSSPTVLGRR
jgi:hypothetical protein